MSSEGLKTDQNRPGEESLAIEAGTSSGKCSSSPELTLTSMSFSKMSSEMLP